MELLVDTQAALWWLSDDDRLSNRARELIAARANRLLVSVASLWEVAVKVSLGKLTAPASLPEDIAREGFELLDVRPEHAWAVQELPRIPTHKDPFGRLLVAQAKVERFELVSSDSALDGYRVPRHW